MEILKNPPALKLSSAEVKKYTNLKEYKEDVLMGMESERQTLQVIQLLLNDTTITKSPNKFAVLDFFSKKYRTKCEVKGRRNNYSTYPTTMLGSNKTDEAKSLYKKGYTILFFFDFKDGLYYFDYKDWETITNHKEYIKKMGGTYRRGLREWKCYNYIPVSCLTKCEFGTGSIVYTKTKRRFVKKNKKIKNPEKTKSI